MLQRSAHGLDDGLFVGEALPGFFDHHLAVDSNIKNTSTTGNQLYIDIKSLF